MSESEEHLFVYGTLMRSHGGEMHRELARGAEFIGKGTVRGELFRVSTYPGLVAAEDSGSEVRGEVYRLGEEGILARLDAYEEFGPAYPEPNEFRRERTTVRLEGGQTVTAWVYFYNRETRGLDRILSGDFAADGGRPASIEETET